MISEELIVQPLNQPKLSTTTIDSDEEMLAFICPTAAKAIKRLVSDTEDSGDIEAVPLPITRKVWLLSEETKQIFIHSSQSKTTFQTINDPAQQEKNRMAARRHRMSQKQKETDVTEMLAELDAKNHQLKQLVAEAKAEIKQLKVSVVAMHGWLMKEDSS